jgi:hypothetical protein
LAESVKLLSAFLSLPVLIRLSGSPDTRGKLKSGMPKPPEREDNEEDAVTSDGEVRIAEEESCASDTDQNDRPVQHHQGLPSDRVQQRSSDEEAAPLQLIIPIKDSKEDAPVTWSSLPRKGQLAILVTARLSEPLVQSSLRVSLMSI